MSNGKLEVHDDNPEPHKKVEDEKLHLCGETCSVLEMEVYKQKVKRNPTEMQVLG